MQMLRRGGPGLAICRRGLQPSVCVRVASVTTSSVEVAIVEQHAPELPEAAPVAVPQARATKLFEPLPGQPGSKPRQLDTPVAQLDAQRFALDPSVDRWANWAVNSVDIPTILQRITAEAAQGGQAAVYWAYHLARFSFFVTQAAAVLAAHTAAEQLSSSQQVQTNNLPGPRVAGNAPEELRTRLWEAFGTWQQDYAWISSGVYKLPWDMVTPNTQFNPAAIARRMLRFVSEGTATLQRRVRNKPEHVWLQGGMYPQYYTKTFHFQTDGWLSGWSADIYEHSTETLFMGRQDAMQRSALVPIASWLANSSVPVRDLKLLEVAAGTGRFHTFIKDNWPEMSSVCSDLSPFYLQKARSNMREWKRLRQPNRALGGVDEAGVEYLQAAAEKLDKVADESVDIVVCVYLFHELPEAVRRKAAAEWFRVLRPGGLVVLADSTQLGDRPEWDHGAGRFGQFNEPYFVNYIQSDLGAMFAEAGFAPGTKLVSSSTKTLSFTKPASPSDN